MQENLSWLTHGGTVFLGKAGLAIHGTTKSSMLTANAATYMIDGQAYAYSADTELQFDTTHTALGNSQVCVVVFGINAAGTLSQYQSTVRNTADIRANGGPYELDWPVIPNAICPYAAIKVETGASATFTFDTTDLDAAGITDTYYDLCLLPTTRAA